MTLRSVGILPDAHQLARVALEHGFTFVFGAVHRLNLFRRVPIAQIEWIIGSNHDVVGADHALQVFDRFDAIDKIVEIEVF